jgi:hypothetical protein
LTVACGLDARFRIAGQEELELSILGEPRNALSESEREALELVGHGRFGRREVNDAEARILAVFAVVLAFDVPVDLAGIALARAAGLNRGASGRRELVAGLSWGAHRYRDDDEGLYDETKSRSDGAHDRAYSCAESEIDALTIQVHDV